MKNKKRYKTLVLLASLTSSLPCFSITLEEAVQHALLSNPDIQFNVAKSLSSQQEMEVAKGRYYPSIDIRMGIGREETENAITNSSSIVSTDDPLTRKEFSIELKQNIFSGFGIVGEKQRLENMWNAQQYKTYGVAEDLSLDVAEKYLAVLKQQRLLQLARANITEHQRILNMIKQRSNAGVSRQAEMEQAKGRLALAHSNFISVENDLRDWAAQSPAVTENAENSEKTNSEEEKNDSTNQDTIIITAQTGIDKTNEVVEQATDEVKAQKDVVLNPALVGMVKESAASTQATLENESINSETNDTPVTIDSPTVDTKKVVEKSAPVENTDKNDDINEESSSLGLTA